MEDWLKSRLSPVKSENRRWIELAETIQQLWEEDYDPYLARQIGLRSIFTASDEDKRYILSELGKYYDIDIDPNSIPIAVIQRRIELFQKDSLVPLMSSYRRACPGIDIRWRPEYARYSTPYGSAFYTRERLIGLGKTAWLTNVIKRLDGTWKISARHPAIRKLIAANHLDGTWKVSSKHSHFATQKLVDAVFLTSRGKLWVNENTVTNPGLTEERIRSRAELTKPLHIVLDGIIWESTITLPGLVFSETSAVRSPRRLYVFGGLRVDGTWRLGRDACNLRLDGTWTLNGEKHIGYGGAERSAHKHLTYSRLKAQSAVDAYSICSLSSWSLPKLSTSYRLNGEWGVGKLLLIPWPDASRLT
jgi:hypothetical protein